MVSKKSKKRGLKIQPGKGSGAGFGTRTSFPQELQRAYKLFAQGRTTEAYEYLLNLTQDYPQHKPGWELLIHVALELDATTTVGRAANQLLQLQPNHKDARYVLAGVAFQQQYPLLAWHLGSSALEQDPSHPMAEQTQLLLNTIEDLWDALVREIDLPRDQAIALLLQHEWGQLFLGLAEYDLAKEAELKVIEQKADFAPAYNNLSLIAMVTGHLEEAIAQAEQVLTLEPENIHALGNLVRYYCTLGDRKTAQRYAEQLKKSQAAAWDPFTKKIEALSYLGDDAGVLDIWDQAKAEDDDQSVALDGRSLHLVAVAMARSGQIAKAKALWRKALERSPNLEIAEKNLQDQLLPASQRHGPWAFENIDVMPQAMGQEIFQLLAPLVQKLEDAEIRLGPALNELQAKYPELRAWLETALLRGDPMGRIMALELLKHGRSPEFFDLLREFALGQAGPDALRNQAAQTLVQADVLDPEKVRMWLGGEWREISIIGFEIHGDPLYNHPRKVVDLLNRALPLLKENTTDAAVRAEALLKQALEIRQTPDLFNNLAVAYQIQGRTEEAFSLFEQLVKDYPTYLAARMSLAHRHLHAEELDAAEALLLPVLKFKRFHFSEFAQFSEGYLELLGRKGEIESAENWLNIWESVMSDHPRIAHWKKRIVDFDRIAKTSQELNALKPKSKQKGKRQTDTKVTGTGKVKKTKS